MNDASRITEIWFLTRRAWTSVGLSRLRSLKRPRWLGGGELAVGDFGGG